MSTCKRYTEAELQQFLSDGIAEMQKENAELLKDKARLDWLADVNNSIGNVLLPTDIVERNLHSMRDAIDEAMAIDSKGSKL
ncbi:MAG TPA: hypothetical protein VFD09_08655 [Thiopseudomonas sp.]|nr:hypothetical protein [Thiopseudomonas sp.]